MELSSKYDPSHIENKWYSYWLERGYFESSPDQREPYCIVIPPPNVTGVLHMGHMLNNTIQDILIRRARMLGKNACWVPGTDHASIATESRVVAMLNERGVKKSDISREEFLKYAWEWKEKHGGIILEQLKKLGASCDWRRTKFTMDADMSESVIRVFIDLYKKGLIYRGVRMVNWDPAAKTAVSDEEVIYKEEKSKLYHVRYKIHESNDEWITIATTRPETILGDSAVCVHPEDDRYKKFKGKKAVIPLINRIVPIIFDEYVDREFGTGALKVTPAHDINDYLLGDKHQLESIDIFNDDGTLNQKAILFVGIDRFAARKMMVEELERNGFLLKTEEYINKVGYSERTDSVIEPRLSMQWFLKMPELAKPALEHVLNGDIKFHPTKFNNTYRHWMENVKDWCISRQLWWGHRIPAWYAPDGSVFVAANAEEAKAIYESNHPGKTIQYSEFKQDEDVLDTWFSSWLWPISVFDGIRHPDNPDFKYYYPTSDLITAPDIIFFWVARMIMAGYEYAGQKPFGNVYFTGMVRDKKRRKMSKSLGNSPDPLDLIAKYGADSVRIGMLFSSPAGNDLLFEESLCEQGRNFNNKIWNAFRLVKQWKVDEHIPQPDYARNAGDWFDSRLNEVIAATNSLYDKYRISDILISLYKLFWDDFASWYLEIIKPPFGDAVDKRTFDQTVTFFEKLLLLLHPFIPFITEELWHNLKERTMDESIMIAGMPKTNKADKQILADFDFCRDIITALRDVRKSRNIPFKEPLKLIYRQVPEVAGLCPGILKKMGNLSEIETSKNQPAKAISFIVRTIEFFIPAEDQINPDEEREKISKELAYYYGFLQSVLKKLENQRFVQNAPAQVIDLERKKEADAREKISVLENKLQSLNK